MSVLSTILLLPIVLAQFNRGQPFNVDNIVQFINNVIYNMIIFARPIFVILLGQYETNDLFFTKILLFILLFVVLRSVIKKTPFGEDNEKIGLIISLIISILAIRYIGENNFLGSIFIQYGALGIAITTIIPMIILFYFINNLNVGSYGRKMFWAIYAITLGGIWASRHAQMPPEANFIYGATFAAAILFIFIDKEIRKYFGLSQFRSFEARTTRESILELKRDLRKYQQDLEDKIIKPYEYNRYRDEILRSIKELSKSS